MVGMKPRKYGWVSDLEPEKTDSEHCGQMITLLDHLRDRDVNIGRKPLRPSAEARGQQALMAARMVANLVQRDGGLQMHQRTQTIHKLSKPILQLKRPSGGACNCSLLSST